MVIILLYLISSIGHLEPGNEVGSQNWAKYINRIRTRNLRIWIWSANLLCILLLWYIARNIFNASKLHIWKEASQKSSKNRTQFFIEFVMRSKKGQEVITSPFWGWQICLEAFLFLVHHLAILDALIQRDFRVFPKITVGNLC